MPIKLASHLYRNRCGVFYFRAVVPQDLHQCFDQREIHRSLHTSDRREAVSRVMILVCRVRAVFQTLRSMPKKPDAKKPDDIQIDLTETVDLNALGLGRFVYEYDVTKPEEVAFVDKRRAELLQKAEKLAPMTASASTAASMKLSEAVERFFKDGRASKRWKDPDTAETYDYGPHLRDFMDIVGDKPIAAIGADDARQYRDAVLDKQSEALGNKDKRLNRVKAFLAWARKQHFMDKDFSGLLMLSGAGTVNQSYEPFTTDELKKLFHSRHYKEGLFTKAFQYWIPLIGLYTGGRINELAQLHVSDIREVEGLDAIDINDRQGKTTKNAASVRTVPIHPELRKAGLFEYVALIREEGHARLFPELRKSSRAKDSFGKEPSRFFTEYRRELGVVSDGETFDATTGKWGARGRKVFHSLRTTANSMLRRKEVPQERRERLVGHESEGINNAVYRPADKDEMFRFQTLHDDLCKLDYGLEHAPYSPKESHRIARQKR